MAKNLNTLDLGGYFERFNPITSWQNYAHYLLGAFFLWLILWFWKGLRLGFTDFFWFAFWFFVVDSLVHAWFWFTPFKWMRWRD